MSMMAIWARIQATLGPGPTSLLQRLRFQNIVLDPTTSPEFQQSITFDNVAVTSPISWTVANGNYLLLTLTSNAVYTLNAVTTGLRVGQLVYLTVRNAIGGAAGAMTLGAAFKASAVTQPANGNSRSYCFQWNGTNLVEMYKSAADVPN